MLNCFKFLLLFNFFNAVGESFQVVFKDSKDVVVKRNINSDSNKCIIPNCSNQRIGIVTTQNGREINVQICEKCNDQTLSVGCNATLISLLVFPDQKFGYCKYVHNNGKICLSRWDSNPFNPQIACDEHVCRSCFSNMIKNPDIVENNAIEYDLCEKCINGRIEIFYSFLTKLQEQIEFGIKEFVSVFFLQLKSTGNFKFVKNACCYKSESQQSCGNEAPKFWDASCEEHACLFCIINLEDRVKFAQAYVVVKGQKYGFCFKCLHWMLGVDKRQVFYRLKYPVDNGLKKITDIFNEFCNAKIALFNASCKELKSIAIEKMRNVK